MTDPGRKVALNCTITSGIHKCAISVASAVWRTLQSRTFQKFLTWAEPDRITQHSRDALFNPRRDFVWKLLRQDRLKLTLVVNTSPIVKPTMCVVYGYCLSVCRPMCMTLFARQKENPWSEWLVTLQNNSPRNCVDSYLIFGTKGKRRKHLKLLLWDSNLPMHIFQLIINNLTLLFCSCSLQNFTFSDISCAICLHIHINNIPLYSLFHWTTAT